MFYLAEIAYEGIKGLSGALKDLTALVLIMDPACIIRPSTLLGLPLRILGVVSRPLDVGIARSLCPMIHI